MKECDFGLQICLLPFAFCPLLFAFCLLPFCFSLNSSLVAHPPQGHDHADGECDAGDDAAYPEEDHFIFDVVDEAGLFGDMEMIDQGLQTFFVHKIAEIAEAGGHDKKHDGCGGDDDDFDPLHSGDECGGQEEYVAGECDEGYNEEEVFSEKRVSGCMAPNWEEHYSGQDQCSQPPQEFDFPFLGGDILHRWGDGGGLHGQDKIKRCG